MTKQKRFKPKSNQRYWYIENYIFKAELYVWFNDSIDLKNYKSGNCFKTKSEAEKKAKEIRKILKQR